MSNRTSAARYARALFDIARTESDPVRVQHDLAAVLSAITEHAELAARARRGVIVAVAEKLGVAPPVTRLLSLLADRRRLELLPDVASVYGERLLDYQNVVQADVRTAAPLAPAAAAALQASLARVTGKQIAMHVTVDPSLLGGVVARVGSTVYDGSVRTQLQKMRDQLVAQG